MCGIVGRSGMLKTDDERVFKTLLLLDYFRGQDSTGVAVVSKKGNVEVLKVADDPIMLFQQQDYDNVVVGVADAIWIGHNRAATIGVTSRANAHPFECDHITGVHNGTLTKENFADLASRLDTEYGTDSETIFQHMAVYGVDDTISRLQETSAAVSNGAWALVWYDSIEKTLNMIRNEKRPLYTCASKRAGGGNVLTWASEHKMIAAARVMANVDDGQLVLDKDGFGYFPLPVNELHTWTHDQLLEGDLTPKTRPLAGKKFVAAASTTTGNSTNTSNNNSNNGKGTNTSGTSYESKGETFPLVKDKWEISEISEDNPELILGVFSEEEWAEFTRYGCSCCGADVSYEDEGIVVYVNEGVLICPKCSDEDKTIVTNAYGINMTERM